jgi:hypothetical protein
VIDRCNLTVLLLPDQADTAEFLAAQGVRIVASLPCYTRENVDQQRGRGVFAGSLEALRRLNALGYGQPGSRLGLDLVYNPLGASLPPDQRALEARYEERELFNGSTASSRSRTCRSGASPTRSRAKDARPSTSRC